MRLQIGHTLQTCPPPLTEIILAIASQTWPVGGGLGFVPAEARSFATLALNGPQRTTGKDIAGPFVTGAPLQHLFTAPRNGGKSSQAVERRTIRPFTTAMAKLGEFILLQCQFCERQERREAKNVKRAVTCFECKTERVRQRSRIHYRENSSRKPSVLPR
jgi:hypothetical protein